MKLQRLMVFLAVVVFVGAHWSDLSAQANNKSKVVLADDCDPTDPGWVPIGGCFREEGNVTRAEFGAELLSPLSASVVGHQSWRNDPAYVTLGLGQRLQVMNKGGRDHTFTRVQNFGGGVLPQLNQGLTPAPECQSAIPMPPQAKDDVVGLAEGNHRFQCCFHPWMRTLVKVTPEE